MSAERGEQFFHTMLMHETIASRIMFITLPACAENFATKAPEGEDYQVSEWSPRSHDCGRTQSRAKTQEGLEQAQLPRERLAAIAFQKKERWRGRAGISRSPAWGDRFNVDRSRFVSPTISKQ